MCLGNLFNGNCSWLLFIIIILLLNDDGDCGNTQYTGGCGCGC